MHHRLASVPFLFIGFLACGLALAACGSDEVLTVDVQTGLVPGPEFDNVEVTLFRGSGGRYEANQVHTISPIDVRFPEPDFVRGHRVAEFEGIEPGVRSVRVRLYRPDETLLIERWVRVRIETSYALTVRLDRDCVDVACPSRGGSAAFTECLAGRCVDPECDPLDPSTHEEHCCDPLDPEAGCPGILFCNDESECGEASECAEVQCIDGACVESQRDGSCGVDEWCDPRPIAGCTTLPETPLEDGGQDAEGPMLDGGIGPMLDAGPPPPADAGPPPPSDAGPPPCIQAVCEQTEDPCRYGYRDCTVEPAVCRPFALREPGAACVTRTGNPGVCITGLVCVDCAGGSPPPVCNPGSDSDGDGLPDAEDFETCDGFDNDGDGATDEGFATHTVYDDLDGDGFGDPTTARETCAPTAWCVLPPTLEGVPCPGEVEYAEDCADDNFYVHPGAVERCEGDDDCDGLIDENLDMRDPRRILGGGSGTEADPYLICRVEHLLERAIGTGAPALPHSTGPTRDLSGLYLRQTRPLALDLEWFALWGGAFHYDGGGFRITGLRGKTGGLFVSLYAGGEIHDLTLSAPEVANERASVGALLETTSGDIRDVGVETGLVIAGGEAGLIAAEVLGGVIERCTVSGTVSTAAVDLDLETAMGGIAGIVRDGMLANLTGNVALSIRSAAGSDISVVSAGGLVGIMERGTLRDSDVTVQINAFDRSGGLIGRCDEANVMDVVASGKVEGGGGIGGLIGVNACSVIRAYADVEVAGKPKLLRSAGGLFGSHECGLEVREVVSVGPVTGSFEVGGLVGALADAPGTAAFGIRDAYSLGDVAGRAGAPAGAFVGSYGTGTVGASGCALINVYTTGRWIGATAPAAEHGGFMGSNPSLSRIENAYYRAESWTAAVGDSGTIAGVSGLTDTEMAVPASFPTFGAPPWVTPTARSDGRLLSPVLAAECGVLATCP